MSIFDVIKFTTFTSESSEKKKKSTSERHGGCKILLKLVIVKECYFLSHFK